MRLKVTDCRDEGHRDIRIGGGSSNKVEEFVGRISDLGVLHISSEELLSNPAIFRQYELLKDPNVREILRGIVKV